MKKQGVVAVALATLVLVSSSAVLADEEKKTPPRYRLVYSNLLAGRYNPLGLIDKFNLGYQIKLWDRPGVLFQDTYMAVLASGTLSPAYGLVGARLEVKPLAVLSLWAEYQYFGTFGTFGILQSFPTPTAEYSDTRLDENDDQDLDYTTGGHEVTLGGRVQAKVWKIAVRDTLNLFYNAIRLEQGHTVYYHQTHDALVPNRGWTLMNEADLLFMFDMGLVVGARYTLIHALYREDHFAPGEATDNPNTPTHRVGPLLAYTFFKDPGAMWDAPTLILMIQWWASHRYRTGADSHAGIPQMVLAFHFKGDLLPW